MYDLLRAPLTCAYCGTQIDAAALDLQTKLFDRAAVRALSIGDEVRIAPDLPGLGYLRIGKSDHQLTALETFSCPTCGAWRWARIVVDDDRLAQIEAVPFTAEVLAATDYVSDDFVIHFTDLEAERTRTNREALALALLRVQDDIDAHRPEFRRG